MPIATESLDSSLSVLVVEDEAFVATQVELDLNELGYRNVTVCTSYTEACKQVAEGQFDVAIFDINVGGMLSYRLISQAIDKGWSVVTMSGFITLSDPMVGRVFLPKPFKKNQLRDAIAKAQAITKFPDAA